MSSRRRFFYNGLLLTLVGIAIRTVQLTLGAYISGKVGAVSLGLNTLVMTVYGFALTFATSGVSLTVTRLVADAIGRGEGRVRIVLSAGVYALGFSGVATLVLLIFGGVIGKSVVGDVRAVGALQILSLSLIPAALSSVISGYFVGVRRVSLNAVVQVVGQVLRVLCTVCLLARITGSDGEALSALSLGVLITELTCFLVGLIEFLLDLRKYGFDGGGIALSPIYKMAFPLWLSAIFRSALLTLEHSLIPHRLTAGGKTMGESLASYGILHGMALPVILYPMSPLSSFSGLLVPEFAEENARVNAENGKARMSRITAEALESTLVYSIMCGVGLYLFSEELGYVIYNSYEAGAHITTLSVVVPIMYLDHVTDSILKGIGEHIFSMWVNVADAILSICLVYVLLPILDIEGYALVIILMELFNFSLSYVRLKKRIKFKINLISSVATPLICALFAFIVSGEVFVGSGKDMGYFTLVSKLVFYIAFFLASRMLFGFIRGIKRAKRRKEA